MAVGFVDELSATGESPEKDDELVIEADVKVEANAGDSGAVRITQESRGQERQSK